MSQDVACGTVQNVKCKIKRRWIKKEKIVSLHYVLEVYKSFPLGNL